LRFWRTDNELPMVPKLRIDNPALVHFVSDSTRPTRRGACRRRPPNPSGRSSAG
jgi:hypothetical protein